MQCSCSLLLYRRGWVIPQSKRRSLYIYIYIRIYTHLHQDPLGTNTATQVASSGGWGRGNGVTAPAKPGVPGSCHHRKRSLPPWSQCHLCHEIFDVNVLDRFTFRVSHKYLCNDNQHVFLYAQPDSERRLKGVRGVNSYDWNQQVMLNC